MFPFCQDKPVRRSQCLQNFHKRRRRRNTDSTRTVHVYTAPPNTFKSYMEDIKALTEHDLLGPNIIEEIDGVQFYRTTVPVICKPVFDGTQELTVKRSTLKIREQPATIIVPENRSETQKGRQRRGKRLFDKQYPDSYLLEKICSGAENEERKKRILAKIESDKENPLLRSEEEEIHERAELFSMSIKPDLRCLSLPEDFSHKKDPAFTASLIGQQLQYPLPKKKKCRNSLTDSCYVSYHTPDDPYDNSHSLPCGTKLYRPPDKLVELVAEAILASPDGLLQVPQIYTILMNKYPYYRYMDKTAVTSWRSSVRHALFQKWFKKLKFKTQNISSKGCFWCINPNADISEIMYGSYKKPEENYCAEDLDIDPDLHENVIALLKEEEQESASLRKSKINTFRLGTTISQSSPVDTSVHFNQAAQNSYDPDPVLTTCSTNSKYNDLNNYDMTQSGFNGYGNAIIPVSHMNMDQTPRERSCISPHSDISNSSTLVISPLINAETLGNDSSMTYDKMAQNWAPTLPFDQVLDNPFLLSNSQSSTDEVPPFDTKYPKASVELIPTLSPDTSSGTSSPDVYNWQPSYELKEKDLLLYLDGENSCKSSDSACCLDNDLQLDLYEMDKFDDIKEDIIPLDLDYLPPTPSPSDH